MYGARRAGPFPCGTWWCLRRWPSWRSAGRHPTADVVASARVGRAPAGGGEQRIGATVGSGSTIAGGRPGAATQWLPGAGCGVTRAVGFAPAGAGAASGEEGRRQMRLWVHGGAACTAATGGGMWGRGDLGRIGGACRRLGGQPWCGWAGARCAAAGRGQDAAVSGSADGRGRRKGGAGWPAADEAARGEASAGPVGLSGGGGRGGRLPRGDRATCRVAGHGPGV